MRYSPVAQVLVVSASFLTAAMPLLAQGQTKAADLGRQQFETNCAVCHGSDASGDKGPALTTPNFVALSDTTLNKIVHDGTAAGMPPFAQLGNENIAAVVHYLRKLQGQSDTTTATPVPGDAVAGRALYFGKAQCSNCHMIQGNGGFMAADLTAYGRSHSADAIRQAIVTPDTLLAPEARVVEVETKAGRKLSGVLRNEDDFNIVLLTEDGHFHFFARSELADVQYTDHSLMPHDYGTRLTPAELDNIISFLVNAGRSTPAEPASPRRDDDD